ncbi:O-acetyl-ADP-ribose deacetylase macrod2 [Coemansia guatemalensis]|uniref:O-acetyl-ADP-ribose deacetylase macrod2 n=1 Tax=Coemansia guatemalensis TaxID=2761395 RepID=A0A9W8LTI8_9FUNG|nr:O-acetyl-ADP-ribose deacetylase macrod2 [Coemansia guatemalensis]
MGKPVTISDIRTVAELLGRTVPAGSFLSRTSIWQGDITKLQVDGIVNAADEAVLGGGGVDGAIHRAAGPQLLEACRALNGCKTGQAKITPGFKLPAKYVIHAVGPVGEKPELLASAYRESLDVAKQNGVRTIAFPCISTGVFGYPADAACKVVLATVKQWLSEDDTGILERVIFCMFNQRSADTYAAEFAKY